MSCVPGITVSFQFYSDSSWNLGIQLLVGCECDCDSDDDDDADDDDDDDDIPMLRLCGLSKRWLTEHQTHVLTDGLVGKACFRQAMGTQMSTT